ncbi:MAG: nodulation protein NodN [Rhodospirillaceae bacterium]|nr:nodulation protein NodN [Rhodospirillaceae bacterium]|tara:strand:+ start:5525 stop:5989 length:465 start_codon:yes stop_codon:yes gene_type:complete
MNKIKPEQLEQVIGKDLGFSDWYQVDQSLINNFAKCTNDEQFIHIDEERSKLESPYGGTIAHGFLSLSLLTKFANESNFSIENTKIVINYGFNKIRFIQPVRSGEKIRAKFSLLNFSKRKKDEILVTYGVNVELENDQKPVLFAEWLILLLLNY